LVAAATGCGGGESPVRESRFLTASQLQQYTCADWRRAGPAERHAVLDALAGVIGGEIIGPRSVVGRGAVLTDDLANRLFDGRCQGEGTGAFRLYRLYGMAAGFAGVAR
jgi:hypothetical protein